MKVRCYLVSVTDALLGDATLYPLPPRRNTVAVLARRGRDLSVRLKLADVDPAAIVTWPGVPDNV